jgi:hypothetical protein
MGLGIPPILAAAQLLDASGAVSLVAKGVSSTFSDLLRTAMTDSSEKTPQATAESSVGSTLKPSYCKISQTKRFARWQTN